MAERKKNLTTSGLVGRSGLRQTGGYVWEELLPELRGQQGARIYRQMADQDEIIGAILFAFTMLMRGAEWTVQPASEDGESEEMADLVEDMLEEMETPLKDVIDEATSMFIYGYAPMEILWKRRAEGQSEYTDNLIAPKAISLRSQHTVVKWLVDDSTGEILGVVQQPPDGPEVEIPIEKMLLFRTTTLRSNPEGRSILRNAYRSWHFKKRLQEIEGIGVERDLAGLPVAYIPAQYFASSASAEDKSVFANWQAMVQSVRRDQTEGLILPSVRDQQGNLMFEFKLLNSGGSRTFNTSEIIQRYDRGIATSVLADFIFLGQQSVGSFALSSDKTALFATALGGFMDAIEDVLNRQLVARIWKYNGLDEEVRPVLKHGDVERQNLGELAAFITAIANAGAPLFPDRELENHLRKAAGLPPAPEESADLGDGGPQPKQPEEPALGQGPEETTGEGEATGSTPES